MGYKKILKMGALFTKFIPKTEQERQFRKELYESFIFDHNKVIHNPLLNKKVYRKNFF